MHLTAFFGFRMPNVGSLRLHAYVAPFLSVSFTFRHGETSAAIFIRLQKMEDVLNPDVFFLFPTSKRRHLYLPIWRFFFIWKNVLPDWFHFYQNQVLMVGSWRIWGNSSNIEFIAKLRIWIPKYHIWLSGTDEDNKRLE